ncbi:hypothetical protein P9112_011789 [Eukaryota sp. TZLM1-RC]
MNNQIDDTTVFLKTQLSTYQHMNDLIHHALTLSNSFQSYISNQQQFVHAFDSCVNDQSLKKCISSLDKYVSHSKQSSELVTRRFQEQVVGPLKSLVSDLQSVKKKCQHREAAYREAHRKEQSFNRHKSKKHSTKVETLAEECTLVNKRAGDIHLDTIKVYCKFENERVNAIRNVLLNHVHMHMSFHASCLQELSKLFGEVKKVDLEKDFLNKCAQFIEKPETKTEIQYTSDEDSD